MNQTKQKYIEALRNIVLYVLPVYTINGEKYVKLEHALQLREFAKEALEK